MKRIILTIIMIICIGVMAVCGYFLVDYFWTNHKAEESFDELKGGDDSSQTMNSDDYKSRQKQLLKLKAKNSDLIGWLNIKDTKIDYPVMQTKEEQDFYLHRDFDKQYSAAGTIFASDISDIDAPSNVILLYGHMMKAGTMFGGIKKYTEKDYWESHKTIRFDTLAEERNYEIVTVFKTAVDTGSESEFKYYNYSNFEDETDYAHFIDRARSLEFYPTGVEISFEDEILMLSTCEYSQTNGRLVVLARRVS